MCGVEIRGKFAHFEWWSRWNTDTQHQLSLTKIKDQLFQMGRSLLINQIKMFILTWSLVIILSVSEIADFNGTWEDRETNRWEIIEEKEGHKWASLMKEDIEVRKNQRSTYFVSANEDRSLPNEDRTIICDWERSPERNCLICYGIQLIIDYLGMRIY